MSTPHTQSDAEILKESIRNPWMFGFLVDRYQDAFLRKAVYILRSRESAEDAVQETFLKIYRHGHSFSEKSGARFSSWAYKILANTCYTHAMRRASERATVRGSDFADLDALGGDEIEAAHDEASFVNFVLSRLPENLSKLLSLYFFEEKSYQEIAISEDLSLSAVKSGLHRAKKRFRETAVEMI